MNIDEFCSYGDFSSEDKALLQRLWPFVEPELGPVVEHFYEKVLAHPTTREIISDPVQVERLKQTLKRWIQSMLNGPWDDDYTHARQRIGHVHVRVGVSHAAMFFAMSAMQEDLIQIAIAEAEDPTSTVNAIRKVTMLDLGLMTSTYHSVEAQKRVRDARMLLIAHLPAAAILLDEHGNVISSTSAAAWLFGHRSSVGAHYRDVLPPSLFQDADFEDHIQRALQDRESLRIRRVDITIGGRPAHVSITLVPLEAPEAGLIAYVQDHTAAVEAERRAQQAEHLAQIGTLTATLAHELRNPLAGISGALQVIQNEFTSGDRLHNIIDRVLKQVRGLNNLVTDLLAYARPNQFRSESGIDVAELCREVLDGLSIDYPNVIMRVRGNPHMAIDPEMVRQVLVNLAINACQAMQGEGELRIVANTEYIEVYDTGPGLPEDVRRRMFEPFFTTKIKGTGLGLAVSKKVARAMGGELEHVNLADRSGTCFRLWLKRKPTSDTDV